MRMPRIVAEGWSYYHCVNRVIERRFLLNDDEKERFRLLLRRVEIFTGVKVLTYAILDNHTHLVLQVPEGEPVSERETLRRMGALYDGAFVAGYAERVQAAREHGHDDEAERLLDAYRYRMHSLSQFMKTLLQRYTQSYNRRNRRRGTLWEDRFKSILIEGRGDALSMMAGYVDLNAVRAGIVDDPKDYRFCGYGEAAAGSVAARAGLQTILARLGQERGSGWGGEVYRKFLFMQGATHPKGGTGTAEFSSHAQRVINEGGKLSLPDLLQCRVRYLSDGVVFGSRRFVEDAYVTYRDRFGTKRRSGPRLMRSANLPTLFTMRDLRKAPITLPA